MATNPETRQIALQHIIARVIFGSMSVDTIRNSLGKRSLLPASVTVVSIALTRWRQLSAFLLNPKRSSRGFLAPDDEFLKPQAREIVTALHGALGAFVLNETRIRQEAHLLEVVLECAKLGYMIFSQPAEYTYQFASPDEKGMVVCPGLRKASNEIGVSCAPETVAVPAQHRFNPEA
ncbi:unnamed protein product [Discula destructiva]